MCTHKAVSSGFARLPVRDHHRLVDVPEGLEVFAERRVVRVVRQPADEDLGEGGVLLQRRGVHDVQGSSVHELMQEHWFNRRGWVGGCGGLWFGSKAGGQKSGDTLETHNEALQQRSGIGEAQLEKTPGRNVPLVRSREADPMTTPHGIPPLAFSHRLLLD